MPCRLVYQYSWQSSETGMTDLKRFTVIWTSELKQARSFLMCTQKQAVAWIVMVEPAKKKNLLIFRYLEMNESCYLSSNLMSLFQSFHCDIWCTEPSFLCIYMLSSSLVTYMTLILLCSLPCKIDMDTYIHWESKSCLIWS